MLSCLNAWTAKRASARFPGALYSPSWLPRAWANRVVQAPGLSRVRPFNAFGRCSRETSQRKTPPRLFAQCETNVPSTTRAAHDRDCPRCIGADEVVQGCRRGETG